MNRLRGNGEGKGEVRLYAGTENRRKGARLWIRLVITTHEPHSSLEIALKIVKKKMSISTVIE